MAHYWVIALPVVVQEKEEWVIGEERGGRDEEGGAEGRTGRDVWVRSLEAGARLPTRSLSSLRL